MFLYGRDIRYRYVDKFKLLDENYNPKQIYTMSTNSGRSILSAEAYLNGLYEYSENQDSFNDSSPPFEIELPVKNNAVF